MRFKFCSGTLQRVHSKYCSHTALRLQNPFPVLMLIVFSKTTKVLLGSGFILFVQLCICLSNSTFSRTRTMSLYSTSSGLHCLQKHSFMGFLNAKG